MILYLDTYVYIGSNGKRRTGKQERSYCYIQSQDIIY